MTLSRMDLVLSGYVRSVQQRKATSFVAFSSSLKGLILKQEVEDRDERKRGDRISVL